jgi:hypothetical protein
MLPFNLLHDCNFFSILFLSHKGLNYDTCYVIHYHTFYSLNVIVTHFVDVVFVTEFVSLCYKIKIIFTCTTLLSITVVNERINQTSIWFLQWSCCHLHLRSLQYYRPDTVIYSFKYIRHWDDFQWRRYIQSSMSLPADWMTNTLTAGMTYQETSLRMGTSVDTDLHRNSN